jgi:acyl-CoA thioesterase FadM
MGTSSVTFHHRARDEADDVVVEGTHTRVTVDEDVRPSRIPDELREALEDHRVDR